jgi:hypothetical protein
LVEKLFETYIAYTSERKELNIIKFIKINAIHDLWNVIKYETLLQRSQNRHDVPPLNSHRQCLDEELPRQNLELLCGFLDI